MGRIVACGTKHDWKKAMLRINHTLSNPLWPFLLYSKCLQAQVRNLLIRSLSEEGIKCSELEPMVSVASNEETSSQPMCLSSIDMSFHVNIFSQAAISKRDPSICISKAGIHSSRGS